MCKVSIDTILKANERMAQYKIGSLKNKRTDDILVSTNMLGKTYRRRFTIEQVNKTFMQALKQVSTINGKTL